MSGRKVVTPHFEILRRGDVIKVVPLHRSRLVIGSEGGADLRLKHPAIASRHLEVSVVQGRYLEARNLAGEGRVLLGGQPMDQARLREGDELDLGPVSLRLSYQRAQKDPAPPPSEDTPTDADAPAPTQAEDDEPTVDEPAPVARPEPAAPTGSRLGKRRRTPPGPRGGPGPSGMDLEIDDIPLDPVPLVTIEPPSTRAQRVPLRVGSFVVGGGRCAFRLSYPGIAPAHAEMMVMPDGLVYLKHLAGSGQVTLRNGAPIQFSRWKSGDRVQVGPVTMQLTMVPQADLADALARPIETVPRKPSAALPRLQPAPPTPPSKPKGLVAAPRSSTLPPSSVPDPLAPQPWTEPPTEIAPAPVVDPAPPQAASAEPLPPPPSAEVPAAAAPPPPSKPLVRVRRKGDPPKKGRKLRQASSPLVQANPVQISLDVRAADTYRAHAQGQTAAPVRDFLDDDDLLIDYRPAWWRRAGLPLLIGLLLAVIAVQYVLYNRPGDSPRRSGGPEVASGQSGVERDDISADNAGGARLVVGDPSKRSARGGGGGGFDPRTGDGWEPDVDGRYADGDGKQDTDALARLAAARADAALHEDSSDEEDESGKPTSSGGGAQGWVEMKDVEKVMWDNRKSLGYCYTVARQDDPGLQGILWLSLTLAADGRIRGAVVEPRSSIQNASLLKCLQRQLFRLDMPTPRGGSVTFSYPFELAQ